MQQYFINFSCGCRLDLIDRKQCECSKTCTCVRAIFLMGIEGSMACYWLLDGLRYTIAIVNNLHIFTAHSSYLKPFPVCTHAQGCRQKRIFGVLQRPLSTALMRKYKAASYMQLYKSKHVLYIIILNLAKIQQLDLCNFILRLQLHYGRLYGIPTYKNYNSSLCHSVARVVASK